MKHSVLIYFYQHSLTSLKALVILKFLIICFKGKQYLWI